MEPSVDASVLEVRALLASRFAEAEARAHCVPVAAVPGDVAMEVTPPITEPDPSEVAAHQPAPVERVELPADGGDEDDLLAPPVVTTLGRTSLTPCYEDWVPEGYLAIPETLAKTWMERSLDVVEQPFAVVEVRRSTSEPTDLDDALPSATYLRIHWGRRAAAGTAVMNRTATRVASVKRAVVSLVVLRHVTSEPPHCGISLRCITPTAGEGWEGLRARTDIAQEISRAQVLEVGRTLDVTRSDGGGTVAYSVDRLRIAGGVRTVAALTFGGAEMEGLEVGVEIL